MKILREFARWIKWHPAYSNLSNLTAITTLDARYQKIGKKIVEFVITFTVTPVIEDAVQFNMALPVPSNIINSFDAIQIASGGTAFIGANPSTDDVTIGIFPGQPNTVYTIRIQYARQ